MKLITVIHWVEVGKGMGVVVLVGAAVGLLQLPHGLSLLLGMASGVLSMLWSMNRWELYHFETIHKK